MSREAFIQSEDKEFEVTFREVRNWEEYTDLDFEADTAPLTDEEAGIEEEPVLAEEWSVVVTEPVEEEPEDQTVIADTEEGPVSEAVPAEDEEDEAAEDDVEADEELVESEAHDLDAESKDEEVEDYASDTSQEAVVTLPVVEDNFDMGPAWEDDANAEKESEDELPVGEPADDTEFFGASLEATVNAENNKIELGEVRDLETYNLTSVEESENAEVAEGESSVISFDPMSDNLRDIFPEATHYDLASVEPVNFDPLALVEDTQEESVSDEDSEEIDTFEAISSDEESLNKADTVEEIAPEYSEDTLPETVAIEAIDSGDYFSFDGIELDADQPVEVKEEDVKEAEESDEDSDDELSLELDYSDEDN